MILVELTEKEFESIRFSVETIRNESVKLYKQDKFEVDRKTVEFFGSILDKMDLASVERKEAVIKSKDLFHIKSMAVKEYGNLSLPISLSHVQVEQKDLVHVALIKSLIMWLNSNNLLKRLVAFDITDDSMQYDCIEE